MGDEFILISEDEPKWQWPESGPPKGPSASNLYWWKDRLREEDGDATGTALIRGLAVGTQLNCEGWIMVKSGRRTGRIFVEGQLSLEDGVIGDGHFRIRGGSGGFDGHAGKGVPVKSWNPKRYTVPD